VRQSERAGEVSVAALVGVEGLAALLLLLLPLPGHVQTVADDLHLQVGLLHSRDVGLEEEGVLGLLDLEGRNEGPGSEGWSREVLEWIQEPKIAKGLEEVSLAAESRKLTTSASSNHEIGHDVSPRATRVQTGALGRAAICVPSGPEESDQNCRPL